MVPLTGAPGGELGFPSSSSCWCTPPPMSGLLLGVKRYFVVFLPPLAAGCIRDSSDVRFCPWSWMAMAELLQPGWETGCT